jgi:hypothetical protein
LTEATKRTSNMLKLGASRQISDYEQHFTVIKDVYEKLLSNLTITKSNSTEAYETATEVQPCLWFVA